MNLKWGWVKRKKKKKMNFSPLTVKFFKKMSELHRSLLISSGAGTGPQITFLQPHLLPPSPPRTKRGSTVPSPLSPLVPNCCATASGPKPCRALTSQVATSPEFTSYLLLQMCSPLLGFGFLPYVPNTLSLS